MKRTPREKVAGVDERGEEGDSQTTVGHRVEEWMRRSEEEEQDRHAPEGIAFPEFVPGHKQGPEEGKEQGMKKTSMAEGVAILDAECKCDHIGIGQDRRSCG